MIYCSFTIESLESDFSGIQCKIDAVCIFGQIISDFSTIYGVAVMKWNFLTLKSLIEEHAHLNFADFLSTLLAIFYVINEKFHPAHLLIYLKSLQNKKDLNDFTAARFLVFFCCWQLRKRHRKPGSCDVIKVLLILWRL